MLVYVIVICHECNKAIKEKIEDISIKELCNRSKQYQFSLFLILSYLTTISSHQRSMDFNCNRDKHDGLQKNPRYYSEK